ncbi:hypothetical protein LZ32DRAFT_21588 [Colletotrichum eremochloae]|nr:hypothetical protein LZ32DRAFT_21588 [Colletotrichum eremochloae]
MEHRHRNMDNTTDGEGTGSLRAGCYRKRSSTHTRSPSSTDTDASCAERQLQSLNHNSRASSPRRRLFLHFGQFRTTVGRDPTRCNGAKRLTSGSPVIHTGRLQRARGERKRISFPTLGLGMLLSNLCYALAGTVPRRPQHATNRGTTCGARTKTRPSTDTPCDRCAKYFLCILMLPFRVAPFALRPRCCFAKQAQNCTLV